LQVGDVDHRHCIRLVLGSPRKHRVEVGASAASGLQDDLVARLKALDVGNFASQYTTITYSGLQVSRVAAMIACACARSLSGTDPEVSTPMIRGPVVTDSQEGKYRPVA